VPHARAYLGRDVTRLLRGLEAKVDIRTYVFPGFDNVAARSALLGKVMQAVFHRLERTPIRIFGLSHFLVLERQGRRPEPAEGPRLGG